MPTYGRGAKLSAPDARDFPFSATHYGAPAPEAVPVSVDLRGGAHPTRTRPVGTPPNQHNLEACVGFSFALQRAALRVAAGAPPLSFSPTFAWFEARVVEGTAGENDGVQPRDVYDAALKIGCPSADVYPPSYTDWTTPPPAAVVSAAHVYRIGSYHALGSLMEIRQALAAHCPVLATVPAGPAFDACPPSGILSAEALADRGYNHEQVIVGYDPTWLYWIGTWGEEWAQQGYFYTPLMEPGGFYVQPWAASLKAVA